MKKLKNIATEQKPKLTVAIDIYENEYVAFRFNSFKDARKQINLILKHYENEEIKFKKPKKDKIFYKF